LDGKKNLIIINPIFLTAQLIRSSTRVKLLEEEGEEGGIKESTKKIDILFCTPKCMNCFILNKEENCI
jgi:hypothetical protein